MSFRDKLKVNNQESAKNTKAVDPVNKNIGKFKSKHLERSRNIDIVENSGFAPSINPVGNTGIGNSQFDSNIPEATVFKLDKIRAQRQPFSHQLTNAVLGGIASGAIGAVEGFANIGDQIMNIGNTADEWERGTFSELLKDSKEAINAISPIYREDRSDTFDWSDPGFYAEVLKGAVDSAVAFGIPGMGYGLAVGKLGNVLGKAELFKRRLDVLTRAGGRALGISNPASKLSTATAGFLSNYNEGTVMGMQTYDEEKARFTEELTNAALKQNGGEPLSEDQIKNIELESSQRAGQAAENVRDVNHFLMLSNTVAVGQMFKGGARASRSMVKNPTLKNWLKGQAKGAPLEASEEIAQGVIQNEASFRAQKALYEDNGFASPTEEFEKLNNMTMSQRLVDFATRDETLLEGLMGLISGPIQFAVTGLPTYNKQKKAQQEAYIKQQGVIERNARFIKDKLMFHEDSAVLKEKFEDLQKEVLSNENKEAQQQKYDDFIMNTEFELLATDNFFAGTTENLEKTLQDKIDDENSTPEEVDAAKKNMSTLNQLETRYNDFMMYQDGQALFRSTLRAERLTKLSEMLDESYKYLESNLTETLNSDLAQNAKQNKKNKKFNLGEIMFKKVTEETVDENGKKITTVAERPINSVTEYVDAEINGDPIFFDKDYNSIKNRLDPKKGGVFAVALANRRVRNGIRDVKDSYISDVADMKTLEYENEVAKFNDAMSISNSENKVKELEKLSTKLENKYGKDKFVSLQARVANAAKMSEIELETAKAQNAEKEKEEIKKKKTETLNEKVENKSTPKTKEDPKAETKAEPKPNVDSESAERDAAEEKGSLEERFKNNPKLNPKLNPDNDTTNESESKVDNADDSGREDEVDDPTGKVDREESPKIDPNEKLENKRGLFDDTKSTESSKPSKPQIASKTEGDKTIDDVEPDISDDTLLTEELLDKESSKQQAKFEEVVDEETGNMQPSSTSVKLMTIGGNTVFINNVQNNFKDKTGVEVQVDVDLDKLPQKMSKAGQSLAGKAKAIFNKRKKEGTEPTEEEYAFLYKYLPVRVTFGDNAFTYVHPMNHKLDTTQTPEAEGTPYADRMHRGELILRVKVINNALSTNPKQMTAKVKGQLPGKLNVVEENKSLSEIPGFEQLPVFYSINGELQPVSGTANPFFDTTLTYTTENGETERWDGVIVVGVKALNGTMFPLKVNTRKHDKTSASIVYQIYKELMSNKDKSKNPLNLPVSEVNKKLFDEINKISPTMVETYGDSYTMKEALQDLIYQGPKTKDKFTELYLNKGVLHYNGKSVTLDKLDKSDFINFVSTYKGFNIMAGKMKEAKYKKHVLSSYLTTNADIDTMFDNNGNPNPTGDSVKRMESGAIYLDVESIVESEAKAKRENVIKKINKLRAELKLSSKAAKTAKDIKDAEEKAKKTDPCKKSGVNKNALKKKNYKL